MAPRGGLSRPSTPTPLQLARLLRAAALDKKAWKPVVIDVRELTSIADYFVICEGETDRQVRAIADAMEEAARLKDQRPLAVDGYTDAAWILLDFDSVLAHVFLPGERSFYDLEGLWARPRKAGGAGSRPAKTKRSRSGPAASGRAKPGGRRQTQVSRGAATGRSRRRDQSNRA